MRPALTASLLFALACGGATTRTLPDESGDLTVGAERDRSHLAGTTPAGPSLGGSRWRQVEARCTEGAPRWMSDDFERRLEVAADATGLVLVTDDRIGEGCAETVAQRATPGGAADAAWSMHEEARVTVGECPTQVEQDRPGDVRLRGSFLEVYVQRSVWCNGLELKVVYAPTAREPRAPDQVLRHYALHFNRRDAIAITSLFAEGGSLVEPFNRTPEGQPTRHDGQREVYGWYREVFQGTPWLAMKVVDIQAGATPGAWVMDWHYMDPRLDAPFGGRNRFTLAGGEVFEVTVEITQPQVEVEGLD
ncbi:MAG: hypothetical protein KF901_34320, partial [Myxococcales bacterium]|nr:hypothetical protein [Myxococcales bacterium]